MKRLLMIAYHFPPLAGSSGIQRTLRFAQDLPQYGWEPLILTAHPRAYEHIDTGSLAEVKTGWPVCRAFALDSARHLSIAGRYPGSIARPDRWISWWLGAVPAGMAMIRRYRPAAIWSTYPIATAHLIGHSLQKLSGLPWLADFRDPMAHDGYPPDPKDWQSFARVEQKVFTRAAAASFASPGAQRLYQARYQWPTDKLLLLENGYDEASFRQAEALALARPTATSSPIVLLHSGIVYPQWRNPTALFQALAQLRSTAHPQIERLRIRFRAAVHDDFVLAQARQHRVADLIELAPPLPYIEALAEMLRVEGLLILQSQGCNDQIPAKTYEYIRAGRPILGLADPHGDTAKLLMQLPQSFQADLETPSQITTALMRWLDICERPGFTADTANAAYHSRQNKAKTLAAALDTLISQPI